MSNHKHYLCLIIFEPAKVIKNSLMFPSVQISHCSGSSSIQSLGEAESEASPVAAVASAP